MCKIKIILGNFSIFVNNCFKLFEDLMILWILLKIEPKAQVSYCHSVLSSVRPVGVNFHISIFYSEIPAHTLRFLATRLSKEQFGMLVEILKARPAVKLSKFRELQGLKDHHSEISNILMELKESKLETMDFNVARERARHIKQSLKVRLIFMSVFLHFWYLGKGGWRWQDINMLYFWLIYAQY